MLVSLAAWRGINYHDLWYEWWPQGPSSDMTCKERTTKQQWIDLHRAAIENQLTTTCAADPCSCYERCDFSGDEVPECWKLLKGARDAGFEAGVDNQPLFVKGIRSEFHEAWAQHVETGFDPSSYCKQDWGKDGINYGGTCP